MLVNNYKSYFENLAMTHVDILHVPGNDPGPGRKKFATYNVDDVISKQLRTKVGFPALLLEMYEWQLKGENVYDAKQQYTGAFTVLDHAKAFDPDDEVRASAKAEKIIIDIIQRLWSDHYGPGYDSCETPFQYLDLKGECVPVGPVFDNEFGWRFEFLFRPQMERLLFHEPPPGTFITITGDFTGGDFVPDDFLTP